MPGGQSRWSAGKDLSWEPLRIERVCEVKYDHMQGDALPPRGGVSALAAGQAAERLPLRSARGHDALRAREGVRRGRVAADAAPVAGVSSGSSASCAGRSSSGTCCRLTRIRVQVETARAWHRRARPRAARCAAASGCRAFQRSSPGERVFFALCARPISISGWLRARGAATAARARGSPGCFL